MRKLPIGPQEGFVFSRVDGLTTATDIGLMTGMGDAVFPVLVKLAELGALEGIPGVQARPPTPPPPAPPAPAPPPAAAAPPPAASPPAESPKAEAASAEGPRIPRGRQRYKPEELTEEVDIEHDKKIRILEIFYVLEELTHYDVLGVPRDADKKAVKAAYYKLAPEFHPDKYFRKNLGAFKTKMETIFKRITEAQEVLSRNQTRAEYDAYLGQRSQTSEIEAILRGAMEEADAVERPAPRPVATPSPVPPPPVAPPPVASPAPVTSPPPVASPPPAPPVRPPTTSQTGASPRPPVPTSISVTGASPRPAPGTGAPPPIDGRASVAPRATTASGTSVPRSAEEERLRKQAFAAKLASGGSGRFAPRTSTPPDASDAGRADPARHAAAADSLRRMAAAKVVDPPKTQVQRYVATAEEAVSKNDAVGAANAYRLAASVDDDPALQALAKDWTHRANVVLASSYLKQGEYEAREGKWPEAARSLVRAAAGMPDEPNVLHAAAIALVRAQGDLHQAADFARRAVAAKPENTGFRVTLAEVYLAANLPLNAKRELEAAVKIDAKDAKVRAMLKRLG